MEEEIDRLNESFLQLSVQLQKGVQMSAWQKERENSAGNHSAVISCNITRYAYNCIILKWCLHSDRFEYNLFVFSVPQISACCSLAQHVILYMKMLYDI